MLEAGLRHARPCPAQRLFRCPTCWSAQFATLQEAVIGVRMLPVDAVFRRARGPRPVRAPGQQVRLRTIGEAHRTGQGLIERIADPLHLVRNSTISGLEMPDVRARRRQGRDQLR